MLASALPPPDTPATEATTATTKSSTKTVGAPAAAAAAAATSAPTASSASDDIIFEQCSVNDVQEIFYDRAFAENWNPAVKGADIPDVYCKIDSEGFFLGKVPKKDGSGELEIVSIVSGVRYGDEQAWIGFYIVSPEHRGKGYGIRSFQKVMQHVEATSKDGVVRPSIGLDAVMAQVDNYRRSGFTEIGWLSERRRGSATELVHNLERDLAEKISRNEIPGLIDLIVREKHVQRHQDEQANALSSPSSSSAPAVGAAATTADKENEQRNETFLGLKTDALVGSDFQDAVESAISAATSAATTALSLGASSSPVPKLADLGQLFAMEQKYTGLIRPVFVREWVRFHADHPDQHRFTAAVISQDQKDPESGLPVVLGYGCIRPAESSYRVGPLYASTPEIAKQLLVKLACDIVQAEKIKPLGVPLEMDIDMPGTNAEAIKLFDGLGWPDTLPCMRMWKGKVPDCDVSGTFGVATLEIG